MLGKLLAIKLMSTISLAEKFIFLTSERFLIPSMLWRIVWSESSSWKDKDLFYFFRHYFIPFDTKYYDNFFLENISSISSFISSLFAETMRFSFKNVLAKVSFFIYPLRCTTPPNIFSFVPSAMPYSFYRSF